jgi:hypothetical protein
MWRLFASRKKILPASSLNMASKNLMLTAVRWVKIRGPRLRANWNIDMRCAALSHAKPSEWKSDDCLQIKQCHWTDACSCIIEISQSGSSMAFEIFRNNNNNNNNNINKYKGQTSWCSGNALQSIRQTHGLNLLWNTVCYDVRHGFTQFCIPIRQRPLPFKSFPIHRTRIILPFDAT